MTRYCISMEGAYAMETLGRRLSYNADAITEASADLEHRIDEADGTGNSLGIYYDAIKSLMHEILKTLENSREDLACLGDQAKQQADMIIKLVTDGLGVSDASDSYSANRAGNKNWEPRKLDATRYGFKKDSKGFFFYNEPKETYDKLMWHVQGCNTLHFRGTCGLCSCVNILRLAGREWTTEEEVVRYAAAEGLCTNNSPDNDMNGGTTCEDRQKILKHFNLDCGTFSPVFSSGWEINYDATIKLIAEYVETGRGVILSVNAYTLWYGKVNNGNSGHAVVVISVKKDKNGQIVEFFICDTGSGIGKWYKTDKIVKALLAYPMNLTGILR